MQALSEGACLKIDFLLAKRRTSYYKCVARGGSSSAGGSTWLWPRRSWVQVPFLTPVNNQGIQAVSLNPFFYCAPGTAHLLGGGSPLHTRQGEVIWFYWFLKTGIGIIFWLNPIWRGMFLVRGFLIKREVVRIMDMLMMRVCWFLTKQNDTC